jgi:hypothetical protein
METQAKETKTFKEVHAELDNEHIFLHQKFDVESFKNKAKFLSDIGFTNSIATRMYAAIAEYVDVIFEYQAKYGGAYKFILKPQLERICEKYNLFVRDAMYFQGDIPEKNIQDMMRFKLLIDDIPFEKYSYRLNEIQRYNSNYRGHELISIWLDQFKSVLEEENFHQIFKNKWRISLNNFGECGIGDLIQIAAVESLFNKDAFSISRSRILDRSEKESIFDVDLDPIVLCETKHGYIIITAWGDEANDELVVNQLNN